MKAGMGRVTAEQHDVGTAERAAARGVVVAVTAARSGIAKRGMPTALARALAARTGAERVCLLDLDSTSDDAAKRTNVAGPTYADVGRALSDGDCPDSLFRGIAR